MTAAQRRAEQGRQLARRLDRIGHGILGGVDELGRVECPKCEQCSLGLELLGTGLALTCGSPARVCTEENKGLCDFRYVVYSIASSQLPTMTLDNKKVVARKPARRRRVQ